MYGTKISKNPAEDLAALVTTQRTSRNLAKAAARMKEEYQAKNPGSTQDMWQAWASQVEENGYCRIVNWLTPLQKRIADVEVPRLMEEMGNVRGFTKDLAVWLPEKFPGKNPMKGSREKYEEPAEGESKPYSKQVKTRNVLQNHPEVFHENAGDSFHVVEQGVGLAPSGKLYPPPKAMPNDAQLKNEDGEVKIYAKLGGTTTLSLAGTDSINPNPDYVRTRLKKDKKLWMQALGSVGHHIRSTADVMKTIVKVTGKYDGVKSDLFAENGKVWLAFRDGTRLNFEQAGDKMVKCNMSIEWVDPIPGDYKVKGSGVSLIEGKVPIVTMVSFLNFPNLFGFDMIAAIGTPSTGSLSKRRPKSRVVFDFAGGKVPIRTPRVLWESGEVPLWKMELSELFAAGPDAEEPSSTLHAVDGAVFHGEGGDQDLGKFYRTVDLDKTTAKKLGAHWHSEGTTIREYVASKDGGQTPVYTFWRMRDENNGGVKYKPNSMTNIIATAVAPDVDEVIAFLREMDFHDRSTRLMGSLDDEIKGGLNQGSWEKVLSDIESEEIADDLSDLLREHYSERYGDADLPLSGEDRDLFAKYFTSG